MNQPRFPDAASSRAVLIGVSHYESGELPPIPAVRANLADLRAALTDPASGAVTRSGCRVLGDDAMPADVGRALAEAGSQASDLLLVYYAGHGLLDDDGQLHLALRSTSEEHPRWTAIPIELIKRELGRARARARVLVLDCCFSGQAVEAMAAPAGLVSGQLRLTGTFTLTSTTANEPSNAPLDSRHTAFTGALLSALASPEPLTLEGIYRHTDDTLTGLGLPRPQCRSVNSARDLTLVRGPAPRRERAEVAPGPASVPEPAPGRDQSPPSPAPPSGPPRSTPSASPEPATVSSSFALESGSRPASAKVVLAIPASVAGAVLSWISFTDPFRNVDPGFLEIAVGAIFGLFFAVAAVTAAVVAITGLRTTSATWTAVELDGTGIVLRGQGHRRAVPWEQISRLGITRPATERPAVVLTLRSNAVPPGVKARNGRVVLGRCKQWPSLAATARHIAPPSVAIDGAVRKLPR